VKNDNIPQNDWEQHDQSNALWEYVRSLSPETMNRLSQPESAEVFQIIEHNVVGLLGSLPNENFDVEVSTSRESLGRMLASAMMSGYFLRNVEQRKTFEDSFLTTKADT